MLCVFVVSVTFFGLHPFLFLSSLFLFPCVVCYTHDCSCMLKAHAHISFILPQYCQRVHRTVEDSYVGFCEGGVPADRWLSLRLTPGDLLVSSSPPFFS